MLLCMAVLVFGVPEAVRAGSRGFSVDYRHCPLHHLVEAPQQLRAARGLKAGELRVAWERVTTTMLGPGAQFPETVVTVIVDDGTNPIVRNLPLTTSGVSVDSVPRGRDLEIFVALTRQGHVISKIGRIHLTSKQTRTGEQPPSSDRERLPAPTLRAGQESLPPGRMQYLPEVKGFRVDSFSHSSVTLKWSEPASMSGLDKYRIESCSSSNADCPDTIEVATPAATETSHTLSDLAPNTPYYYRIAAQAAQRQTHRDSAPSSVITATTSKIQLPAVANFRVRARRVSVTLKWAAPSASLRPAKYRIESCSSSSVDCPDATEVATPAATATSHILSGLTPDTTYYYRITALAAPNSAYQDSIPSAIREANTVQPRLARVAGLTVASTDHESVTLNWTAPFSTTNIANFQIKFCAFPCSNPAKSAGAPAASATSHTVTGLAPNTTYYFRIRARAKTGYTDSVWSPFVRGETTRAPLPAISGFTSRRTDGGVSLTWNAVSHRALDKYRVEVCSNANCSGTPTGYDTTEAAYVHACTQGTSCYYRVRAKAKSDEFDYLDGPWSSVLTVQISN